MGIDHKIEEAKNCFKEIQQSGRNNYQKYNYMEVKDIFPIVREVCKKFKMRSKFDWKPEQNIMELTLKDLEDGSTDVSTIPVAPVTMGDAGKYMQDIGRCQTYAQRYLYIQVFEIAVPDNIDNQDQKKMQKPKQNEKPVKTEVQKQVEPVKVSHKRIKEILDTAYQRVTVDAGKEFTLDNARWVINNLCNNDNEKEAVFKALSTYTANTVGDSK